MEERVGFARLKGDRGIDEFDFEHPTRWDMQVRHVAGMADACQDAVSCVARIEVRTRRLERWRVALANRMNVEGMLAWAFPLAKL